MKIAIDIDGVLADFISPFLEFHNQENETNFQYEDVFSHDLWQVLGGTPQETGAKFKAFHDSPKFRNIKPISGAIESINYISNHELAIITSRPIDYRDKTLVFLKEHFPKIETVRFSDEYQKRHINPNLSRKIQFCSEFQPNILLEDHAKNARDCSPYCKRVILFNQPWNQNQYIPGNVIRVNSWEEALKNIS